MPGNISCLVWSAAQTIEVSFRLETLRNELLANPLYSSIESMKPDSDKTASFFHAKDDHAEIRAKLFELLLGVDFKFYAIVKDMRKVLEYVQSRKRMNSTYSYHPNELYDLTVRMLFKNRLHKDEHVRITFARRGNSDRTAALTEQLQLTRERFVQEHALDVASNLQIVPAYPQQQPGLQVADYCLWALQRCYERQECRFLRALWTKVSLIHDVDDPNGPKYGTYLTRKSEPPDPIQIKNRWI